MIIVYIEKYCWFYWFWQGKSNCVSEVKRKYSSEINEDAQTKYQNNSELKKLETFLDNTDTSQHTEIETESSNNLLIKRNEFARHSFQGGGNFIYLESTKNLFP